ncbi:MAG TPA: c-type cytochrome [Burkholderiales bacterium]|jgi:cytochrome c5|nr:c-type cytochrome [Burkholderiales bacterium]
MNPPAILVAIGALLVSAGALADTGEEVYQNRCSLCHAGGAGGAPKFRNRDDWAPRAARGKLALYDVALHGKPDTAMRARGGFRDLSNDEVMAAVDYMVAQAGFSPGLRPEPAPAAPAVPLVAQPSLAAAPAEFDDKTATARIAEALLVQLAPPDAKIEMQEGVASVGDLGIRVGTREGVVWLRGTVKSAELIERAEVIARSAGGGRTVENRLISAQIFERD